VVSAAVRRSITSAGYGFRVDNNIAMGFVDGDHGAEGPALEISIIGTRYSATIVAEPIFDPQNARLKG